VSEPFRLGIIGGGRMGRTHLRALQGSEAIHCAAIAEPFEASAQQLREQGHTVYATAEEMFAGADLDGVLIAVPTDQHADTARAALEAGLPVLCEKPFGLSSEIARELATLASERGLALQIGYWRRFIPELAELRHDIHSGALGTPHLLVCSQWDEEPPPASFRNHSGGIYIDMGVHEIEQTLWLLNDDISRIDALAFPGTEDSEAASDVDSAQALLGMSNGCATVVSLGRFYRGGDIVTVELFGSQGHRRFDVVSPATGEQPQLRALRRQAEAFARYARGGAPEGTTALEAARVLDVAHELTEVAAIPVIGDIPVADRTS
jgi:myo-inositol 2-dehydrogenase/D-chiro-inositol 1-dehydrogenase